MSTINLNELNQFVKNYYDQIGLSDLEAHHAGRIREWFKDNLSLIGVYAHRDAGRFGNFKSENEDDDHFGRADGWVSLTEEVPDIDHLTYGTGVLYVHGEMEIPSNEDGIAVPKDNIFGDEFYHVDKTGATKHIYQDLINPERFIDWNDDRGDKGAKVGYVWDFVEEDHTGTIGDGRWLYETITDTVGGVFFEEKLAAPSGNGETPTVFNDDEVYNVDNDRHHFPWVVINSAKIKSIKDFLDEWEGKNGMYDEELPQLAKDVGTYPPHVQGGIKYVKAGKDGILDFLSPIDEVPE
jgi:hypothetical protein